MPTTTPRRAAKLPPALVDPGKQPPRRIIYVYGAGDKERPPHEDEILAGFTSDAGCLDQARSMAARMELAWLLVLVGRGEELRLARFGRVADEVRAEYPGHRRKLGTDLWTPRDTVLAMPARDRTDKAAMTRVMPGARLHVFRTVDKLKQHDLLRLSHPYPWSPPPPDQDQDTRI